MPNEKRAAKTPEGEGQWVPVRPAENQSNPKPEEPRFSQPKEPVKRTKGDDPSTCGCDL